MTQIDVDSAAGPRTNGAASAYIYPFHGRSIAPLKKQATAGTVVQSLRQLLGVSTYSRCQVWGREDDQFQRSIIIFNGAAKSPAVALVKPQNAEDVSKIIKFCRQHELEVSVKAGGTGVHGWSVAGHVIIDLALMNHITVHKPSEAISLEESFANLQLDQNGSSESTPIIPKRPSLSTSNLSSETATLKRGSADEGQDGHDSKRRMDTIDRADRSLSDPIQDLVSGSSSASGSRSSRPGESSRSGSQPTAPTSTISNGHSQDGKDPSPTYPSSSSSSRSNSNNGLRVTYVNPSPTVPASHPFVVTSPLGAESSSYPMSSPTLVLNTHPSPPDHTIVTFGAGVHSKQLDSTTARSPYGAFHVPTSAFPVGSGQFVLGGFGFMGRQYGLAMDSVVEAEMVLADGRIVWVGEGGTHGGEWKVDEDPTEVWWALRGAGPALGVITRFRAKAYYLPSVFAGNLIYVFDRQTTPSLLRHIRDVVKGSPRRQYTNIIMTAGPPGAPAIVVIQLCSSGPRAEGEAYLQAISSWEGGRCMFQDFSERTFERQQVAVEEVLKGGQGKKWYIKSDMLMSLDDDVIDQTCERFSLVPDGCTWLFEYTGGGIHAEVKDSCYPVSHREGHFTVAALHQWGHDERPEEDNRCVTTAEQWINEVIHPHSPGGPLPCFLQSSHHEDVAAVYGENFARLALVKAMIDPENSFKHSFWPRPGGPGEERLLGEDTGAGDPVKDLANGELTEVERQQYNEMRGMAKGKGRAYAAGIQDLGNAISGKDEGGSNGVA